MSDDPILYTNLNHHQAYDPRILWEVELQIMKDNPHPGIVKGITEILQQHDLDELVDMAKKYPLSDIGQYTLTYLIEHDPEMLWHSLCIDHQNLAKDKQFILTIDVVLDKLMQAGLYEFANDINEWNEHSEQKYEHNRQAIQTKFFKSSPADAFLYYVDSYSELESQETYNLIDRLTSGPILEIYSRMLEDGDCEFASLFLRKVNERTDVTSLEHFGEIHQKTIEYMTEPLDERVFGFKNLGQGPNTPQHIIDAYQKWLIYITEHFDTTWMTNNESYIRNTFSHIRENRHISKSNSILPELLKDDDPEEALLLAIEAEDEKLKQELFKERYDGIPNAEEYLDLIDTARSLIAIVEQTFDVELPQKVAMTDADGSYATIQYKSRFGVEKDEHKTRDAA
jgi:hypothetical protein